MIGMQERYLSLLKKSLLNELYIENEARIAYLVSLIGHESLDLRRLIFDFLNISGHEIFSHVAKSKHEGGFHRILLPDQDGNPKEFTPARNLAFVSHSMIGRLRMDNLHYCMDQILANDVPGDFIETGVWRGGATIFMRGYLSAHQIADRTVWVADSFEGLPPPSRREDEGAVYTPDIYPYLSVGLEEVKELFARYELLDEQVRFLKGWFRDTLPQAPIEKLALLRLDGDLYESTIDALDSLYGKVSDGGFVIVDDFNALPQCEAAVMDFRARNHITCQIRVIDEVGVYWEKRD